MLNADLRKQINENPIGRVAGKIVAEIQQAGYEAYFVGGGVRDLLIGRVPKDFDIATVATPDVLKRLFPDCAMVGAKFGVILLRRDNYNIEVATFREEGEYHDRRRPESVQFTNLENDARRRDFTANALYYDPIADKIKDQVGGLNDIQARLLRAVGDPEKRFSEDALRILRGVRFAANLEFEIESATWKAMKDTAPLLKEISVERVRDELINGFTGGHPARFLELLDKSGILKIFLPEILEMKGCAQPPEFHPEGDVFEHTMLLLQNLKPRPSIELAFAVLLHDIGKPQTQTFEDRIRFNGHDKAGAEMVEIICGRLRFSNSQTDAITNMVRRHMQFMNVPNMRQSTLNRFLASDWIEDELELHRVDCLASHQNLDTYDFSLRKLNEFRENETLKGELPKPLITGADLIKIGMKPGPAFKSILHQIFDAQMDGSVSTRDDGLRMARDIAGD